MLLLGVGTRRETLCGGRDGSDLDCVAVTQVGVYVKFSKLQASDLYLLWNP